MMRKLLATTALAALIATGALAQNDATPGDATPPPATNAPATPDGTPPPANDSTTPSAPDGTTPPSPDAQAAPGANTTGGSGGMVFNRDYSKPSVGSENGYFAGSATDILASNLIGKPVYSGTAPDAETIGDVNDVLMGGDGAAQALVIGVGGFLGIGEKEVAIDFARVNWVDQGDGTRRLVVDATADDLNNAPSFDRNMVASVGSAPAGAAMTADQVMTGGPAANPEAGDGTMANPADANAGANADMSAATPADTTVNGNAATEPNAAADGTTMNQTDADSGVAMNGAAESSVVDQATLSADDLMGAHVLDANGDDIGSVSDVILATDSKTIVAYVVDVGGFLGIGQKPVALAADSLQIARDADGNLAVHTQLSEDQLNNGPSYSEDAYKQNPDSVLVR